MDSQAKRDIRRKLQVFQYAAEIGNVRKACRRFGLSRSSFYEWKKKYKEKGEQALINSKPCPKNPALRTSAH